MATRTALNISAPKIDIERGAKFAISLPESAGVLSEPLQLIARQYLSARRRSGEALIDMGRWLNQARQAAQHGEWNIFLEATDTTPDTAERLMNIYQMAQENAQFADAITRNWLTQSAAALLARDSTPTVIVEQALSAPKPPTKRQIESSIRETKIRTGADFPTDQTIQPMLPGMPEMAQPADLPPEFAIVQRRLAAHGVILLSNIQGREHMFVTRTEGGKGIADPVWAHILEKAAFLDEQAAWQAQQPKIPEAAPAESAAPFWQSMSPQHPTAHLWTRVGMNEHHAACGMATQRAPSGSTETGHCSSCVRATWKTAAEAPAPEPAPLPPDLALHRPKRPVSADVSAHTRYVEQLESYTSALEQLVIQLRAELEGR